VKIIFLSIFVFLIDQLSKLLVRGFNLPWFSFNHNGFDLGETKQVINNLFHITLVENPGIAFGIVPGDFLKELIIILTIFLCLGFVVFLLYAKNSDWKIRISVGLILAGAAGNLFDRIFYGYLYGYAPLFKGKVVDFIDLQFIKLFTMSGVTGNYVFNFADLSIICGVVFLIYIILKYKTEKQDINKIRQFIEER